MAAAGGSLDSQQSRHDTVKDEAEIDPQQQHSAPAAARRLDFIPSDPSVLLPASPSLAL